MVNAFSNTFTQHLIKQHNFLGEGGGGHTVIVVRKLLVCFGRKSSGENTYFVQKSSLSGVPSLSDQQCYVGLESACTVSIQYNDDN